MAMCDWAEEKRLRKHDVLMATAEASCRFLISHAA